MGGNMSPVDMIPISTVNLVNSVEGEKKSDHPENQSEQLREVTEAAMVA